MRFWLMVLVTVLLAATVFAGKLYYWKDENGKMRYGENPPNQGMKTPDEGITQKRPEQAQDKVDVYITDACPYCKMAIRYLEEKGVRFSVYNVDRDRMAAQRMIKLSRGRRGVPFAMIYGTPVTGFSEEVYDKALSTKPRIEESP